MLGIMKLQQSGLFPIDQGKYSALICTLGLTNTTFARNGKRSSTKKKVCACFNYEAFQSIEINQDAHVKE
jgi:hypothetical protein